MTMGTQMRKHNVTGLLSLLVFALFAVSVLMILLTGADVVQKLTRRGQRSYDLRTAAQYVTTRVRQGDRADAIEVRSLEEGEALVLTEEIDGGVYETLVYCHDGYLREMFCRKGLALDLTFGEKILPLSGFSASEQDGVLQVRLVMPDGEEETLVFLQRSGREMVS